MRILFPTILIIIALALFFVYIDPTYDDIQELRAEQATYDDALDRAQELIAIRDQLLATYNSFSSEDLERLRKILPDHVDSVRLIIDVDNIAAQYGLRIDSVSVDNTGLDEGQVLGVANLGFTVDASYSTLREFLADIEDSLRVLEVTNISFNADDADDTEYAINLKTYWLR